MAGLARALARLACFTGLAILHTWPLATAPAVLSRHDNADTLLNEWILAWVAHALSTHPLALFSANIFHPEPRTLAFSEHLLTPSLIATPLLWAGVPTLAAHNLALIAGLALTGFAMAWAIERWTGNLWAGLVAGSLLAFNAHTLTRLAHVQAAHVEFLPLALVALDRVLVQARLRDAVMLAISMALQALASGYLLVMTVIAMAAASMARLPEWTRVTPRRALLLAGAALGASLLLVPFLLPYYHVSRDQGLVRPLAEVALYSATPSAYLSTAGRLHYALWARPYFGPDSLFPGVTAILLAAVSLWRGGLRHSPRVRMLAALGAAGAALSFGPALSGYAWLHAHLPLLQGIRGPARFGFLLLVAIAGLAGLGFDRLQRRDAGAEVAASRPSRRAATLGLAALVLVNLEAVRAPISWSPALRVPAIYTRLATEPPGALVELPFPAPDRTAANAPAVLGSTRHFRPLLNGYSGFVPASYGAHAAALAGFPDGRAMALLHDTGVTHVIVHGAVDPRVAAAAASAPGLELLAVDGAVRLYRVRR